MCGRLDLNQHLISAIAIKLRPHVARVVANNTGLSGFTLPRQRPGGGPGIPSGEKTVACVVLLPDTTSEKKPDGWCRFPDSNGPSPGRASFIGMSLFETI